MTKQCKNCGKELKDKTSQLRGFGPECWNHALKKGVLEIPLVIRTSAIYRDASLFEEVCEKADLFFTIDGKEVFEDGWHSSGSWSHGFVPDNKEFMQGKSMVHELLSMGQENFDYGRVSICLWANKDAVPSDYMPERPANPDNLPYEFSGAIPILSFNCRDVEVMNLVPNKWQIDKKEKQWRMVYDTQFGSGPLYTEIEDGMEYGYGGDGSHRHELISEWLCEGVEDAPKEILGGKPTPTSNWLPTTNLETWVRNHPSKQFWIERKELKWLRRMMTDRAIVVSFYGDTEKNILGNAYESHSKMWDEVRQEAQENFCWAMILMSLEEGTEEIGDEMASFSLEHLRCNMWNDFFEKETDYGYDLLFAYNFYDAFEKEYLWEYLSRNPIRDKHAAWKPKLVSREAADTLYSKDPKWLRTAKWNLWQQFYIRHTELWYQEYQHYSDYEYDDSDDEINWKETYNADEDAVGDTGLIWYLENEVKESAELMFKWIMNLNANVFSRLGMIENLDLVAYYDAQMRMSIRRRYDELVGN